MKLIATKKQAFFKEKILESIGKLKELWESFKYLGMPDETLISNFHAMQDNDALTYDTRSISTIFENFLNLAKSLLTKLPKTLEKDNLESVMNY